MSIYVHKNSFDSWPAEVQQATREAVRQAVTVQRNLAAETENALRAKLERDGIAFVDLTAAERSAFREAVQPVLRDARKRLGNTILAMAAST